MLVLSHVAPLLEKMEGLYLCCRDYQSCPTRLGCRLNFSPRQLLLCRPASQICSPAPRGESPLTIPCTWYLNFLLPCPHEIQQYCVYLIRLHSWLQKIFISRHFSLPCSAVPVRTVYTTPEYFFNRHSQASSSRHWRFSFLCNLVPV